VGEREDIEGKIRAAFAGIRLGSGVSLRQAEAIDRTIFGIETPDFGRLPLGEVTDDWTLIPEDELLRDNIAHLDGEGLRYYLPALLLWTLEHYDDEDRLFTDGADMTVIGTMSAIAPYSDFRKTYEDVFETWFTDPQRRAIAALVEALHRLVHLDWEDSTRVTRALERYWSRYLAHS
jgi:hypothetical protein